MQFSRDQIEVIKRCQKSCDFFLRNFGKIKHPSAGILPFRPFSYQRRALKCFREHRLNIFRKCFAEGSCVWTPNGPKKIETIKPGDVVYAFDECTQSLTTSIVNNSWSSGEKETVVIRTKSGHRSICTLDHPFLTRRGWVQASDLTLNDVILEVNDSHRYLVANKSEAILLGYLITDGYYSGYKGRRQFHFTNTTWRYLLEYQKHFELRFNKKLRIRKHNKNGKKIKKKAYRLLTSCVEARRWLKSLGIWGDKAETKKIPDVVFSWDNKSISILLNRMFAGDGWYSGKHCNEAGIGSKSILLLNQIKQLLTRFGIDSKVYDATDTSIAKLRIFGTDSFARFVDQIGIFGKKPRHIPTTKGFFRNRIKGQIKSITPGGIKPVWDLEIDKYHNFIIDGAVVHNCRQAGISKIAGGFATWFGMFHSNKKILIVSRKNDDAMSFLRENIAFIYENLPDWMKDAWRPIKQNEHEILFPNNSHIQSLTSHPDVLRSHASSLNILDEVAFIPQMDSMWASGWPCSRGDTLIQTDDGLIKIEDLAVGGNPWKDISINVATDEGYQHSNKAFVSGRKPTTIINTYLGFEFEAASHHKVRVIDGDGSYVWKRLDQIKINDIVISIPGMFNGNRRVLSGIELNEEVAEILGLYVGDGSLSINRPKRFKIFFDPQDIETRDIIVSRFNNVFDFEERAYPELAQTTVNLRLNSAEFVKWMVGNGLVSKTCPQDAQIPSAILRSDEPVICAFLRGLFDSDGWCYPSSTCLKLGLSTASEKLAEQVQVCLHALGIISRRILINPKDLKNEDRYSEDPYWRVEIYDSHSKLRFRDKIGFITQRKQEALESFNGSNEYSEIIHDSLVKEFADEVKTIILNGGTFRDCKDKRKWNIYRIAREGRVRISLVKELTKEFGLTNRLSKYVNNGFSFDTVIKIKNGEAELYDLSVPYNNTYLANGMVSHNTLQHGGSVIAISTCVAPDTLVMTANGLCEIQELAPSTYEGFDDGYYHANYHGPDIVGINGLEKATKFYKRPTETTKIVRTSCGYEFEASLLHKLPVVMDDGTIDNRYIKDLKIGDFLPVKSGQMVFGDNNIINYRDSDKRFIDPSARVFEVEKIDEDLAYLLGVIIAEGHVKESYRADGKVVAEVVIACGDAEVLDKCESWGNLNWNRGREGQDYVTVCSSPMFVRFLKELGVECTTAPFKTIPKRLLQCSESIIRHFLRGLFDGDGAAHSRQGQVCYISTSKKLIKQVRMLLFNYGIHTYLEVSPPGTTTFRRKNGEITTHDTLESYRLYVSSNFTNIFYDLIGFDLNRKQSLQNNKTAVWSELMPPVVKKLLKQLKDTTDLTISKMTRLGLAPNVLYGTRERITKSRLESFISKIDYTGNQAYDSLVRLLEYDWFNEIKSLDDSENEVYDFTLPKTHTFIGDCIVHTNTNGVGGWYYNTMSEAEAHKNNFNPIVVNWWDMDWAIEYMDSLTRKPKRICPIDGIRPCTTKQDIEKYGPYWSPWLEEQWQALQEQGESWKYDQEILAKFVGSGNTILNKTVLAHLATTIADPVMKVEGVQTYVHPVSGEIFKLDFTFPSKDEGFWIWEKPIGSRPDKYQGNRIIERGSPAKSYSIGVDISTGKGKDYSAIEVIDVGENKQVAEFMARVLPTELAMYIDMIGRYYNYALLVIERNNGGDIVIDDLRYNYMYQRLWRKKDINDKPGQSTSRRRKTKLKVGNYGFTTSGSSKPGLNKLLIDYVRDTDDSLKLFSSRLLNQLHTYVRKRDRSGKDTSKTEAEEGINNFDDLVMALCLSLNGMNDALDISPNFLVPVNANTDFRQVIGPKVLSDQAMLDKTQLLSGTYGSSVLMPMTMAPSDVIDISASRLIDDFTLQLGGIPMNKNVPLISSRKYFFDKEE